MKNLAIIPARSGSKGLPDKNIKPLLHKPLLAWSVEAALRSEMFDTVHVSTDTEHYADIARMYGADVPFLRSAENSTDTASSWAVVLEALKKYQELGNSYDTVMLLQPTSPLRTPEDIRQAYQLMAEKQAKTVVAVCETDHPPQLCGVLPENLSMDGFIRPEAVSKRRQDLVTYYRINGAIYLLSVNKLLKWGDIVYDLENYAYVMPPERSIDIDSSLDFLLAETILNRLRNHTYI